MRFWDGTELPATSTNGASPPNGNVDPGPIFTVRSPKAVAHVVRAPGELGLGWAYVAGELEVDDLDRVIGLIDDFEEPRDRQGNARTPCCRGA